jgi:4-carboxymuconolactone decarboxylase
MNDKWQAGHDLMVRMMGPQFADAMEANARSGGFGADVARLAIEQAFGDVWARPGLDLKTRSTIVISVLIATAHEGELKNHIRFGLNNGLTPKDIEEIVIQTIPYVGFAVIAKALGAAIEVFRERGIELGARTAQESGVM